MESEHKSDDDVHVCLSISVCMCVALVGLGYEKETLI